MLSLTPFFANTLVPALSTYSLQDYELDSDLARIYSMIKEEPTVYHRQPNYSLVENEQQAHVDVELPGVAKENITLDITGNKLAITAKRFRERNQTVGKNATEKPEDGRTGAEENAKDADMKEAKEAEQPIPCVVYELVIRIGRRYDTENIQANMDGNGILKMVIPMKKKEGPRKIWIE